MPELMIRLPDAITIALYGAALSTVLAVVKVWEIWRDRFRLDIGCTFVGNPEVGHEIRIRNLSTKPFILKYWDVFYGSSVCPFQKEELVSDRDFGNIDPDTTIAPASTHTLIFADESYFSVNHNSLRGRSVYIRLHIAGRKPIRRKLYPF
ncbi:hypothetical protein GCM10027256_37280 [Novispirillum itersonii subsp. nipponicum]